MSLGGKLASQNLPCLTLFGTTVSTTSGAATVSIKALLKDEDGMILLATGTGVPDDAVAGFAKGCLFIDTDVAAGTTGLYVNVGTTSAANFDAVSDA